MSLRSIPGTRQLRRYRASFSAVMLVLAVAIWPGLLFPLARAYVEFSFHHPFTSPLTYRYPPFVVAAFLLWISPMILIVATLTVRQVVGQLRLYQKARGRSTAANAKWTAVAKQVGIADRLVVIRDDEPFAFCTGFFRPSVYVSDGLLWMLETDEVEAVLRHETSHLQRRDPLRLFLVELLHIILAPLPVVETLCDRVRIEIELTADRAALAIVPMPALAGAVLKVARASTRTTPIVAAGLTASEARIDALLGRPVRLAFTRRDLIVTGFGAPDADRRGGAPLVDPALPDLPDAVSEKLRGSYRLRPRATWMTLP